MYQAQNYVFGLGEGGNQGSQQVWRGRSEPLNFMQGKGGTWNDLFLPYHPPPSATPPTQVNEIMNFKVRTPLMNKMVILLAMEFPAQKNLMVNE